MLQPLLGGVVIGVAATVLLAHTFAATSSAATPITCG